MSLEHRLQRRNERFGFSRLEEALGLGRELHERSPYTPSPLISCIKSCERKSKWGGCSIGVGFELNYNHCRISATSLQEASKAETVPLNFCTPEIFNIQVALIVLTNKETKKEK
jgi:hypothetical protein